MGTFPIAHTYGDYPVFDTTWILMRKYNNDDVATVVAVSNFGFVLYVLCYMMDNRLHYDILVLGIPIEEPSDVCCG